MKWNDISKYNKFANGERYNIMEEVILKEMDPNSNMPQFSKDQSGSFYDATEDKLGRFDLTDKRKPQITLKLLNKLKKMRANRRIEMKKKTDLVGVMYADAEDDQGGGGGDGMM